MKLLIIQHEVSTPPGSTIDWCLQRDYQFQIIKSWQIKSWPNPKDFDLVVICGGGMNVDQEELYPWLREEKEFLHQLVLLKTPQVGLCLGAQLLAEVLGATVKRHPHWEVGWHDVKLADGNLLKVFQWHGYSFSLPSGAELVATNEICANQAFCYDKKILGFQFHPEASTQWVLECSDDPDLPKQGYVQSGDEIKRGLVNQPVLQAWYFSQLDSLINSAK